MQENLHVLELARMTKKALERHPHGVMKHGLGLPHSARIDYEWLGLEPVQNMPLSILRSVLKGCGYAAFDGYRGGDTIINNQSFVVFTQKGTYSAWRITANIAEKMFSDENISDAGVRLVEIPNYESPRLYGQDQQRVSPSAALHFYNPARLYGHSIIPRLNAT